MDAERKATLKRRIITIFWMLFPLLGGLLALGWIYLTTTEYLALRHLEIPLRWVGDYRFELVILCMPAIPILGIAALVRKGKERVFTLVVICFLAFFLFAHPNFSSLRERAWSTAFHQVIHAGTPLVKAIEQYEADHNGAPPPSLNALVPTYISAIPGTGIRAFPAFRYNVYRGHVYEGRWALNVPCPRAILDFSYFEYMENESNRNIGELHERQGHWIYIRD